MDSLTFYEGNNYYLQKLPIGEDDVKRLTKTFVYSANINIENGPHWEAEIFEKNSLNGYSIYQKC